VPDLVEEGASRLESLGVIAVAQAVDTDFAVGGRRMDEARVADVDADVRIRAV